jgi:hypothetical protein
MLSRDLERYIDDRRALGFKLRSQSVQLRSFVAFAEQQGDRYIKSARVLAWASQAPSPEHRPTGCSRYAASHWLCVPRTPGIRFPKQKRSGASRPSAARRISMRPMRSRACLGLQRHSSLPAP